MANAVSFTAQIEESVAEIAPVLETVRLKKIRNVAPESKVRVLRADVCQAAQTASNLSVGLGTRLNVMRERVRGLEEAFVASQPSHQP
ncbi:hypothetical protein V7S43_012889 [Phytophthora oleae]|uniref:Uncharacterized protein n=1 Tax=Phytophthora oleae TaxID=2107226 RepID=A0ABD3F734_9STRA